MPLQISCEICNTRYDEQFSSPHEAWKGSVWLEVQFDPGFTKNFQKVICPKCVEKFFYKILSGRTDVAINLKEPGDLSHVFGAIRVACREKYSINPSFYGPHAEMYKMARFSLPRVSDKDIALEKMSRIMEDVLGE